MSIAALFGSGIRKLGSSGPPVTLLHTALLRLNYAIDPAEVVNALFGKDIHKTVLGFQVRWSRVLGQTGAVDDATALLLYENFTECKQKLFVYGIITLPNKVAASHLTVQIFDRDLRREERLASVVTTESGYFHCQYLPEQFSCAGKGSADLVIWVLRGSEVLYNPTLSDIIFNAPDLAIVNITLSKMVTALLDEYTNIITTVHPLAEGQDVDIASLQEDSKIQDITFLVKEASLDGTKLVYVAVASKLSPKYEIQPELFYALFVEQTLANASNTATPLGTRVTIGLDVDLTLLFHDIVLLPPESVEAAIKSAVADSIVPRSLLDTLPKIQKQLSVWCCQAEEYVKKNPIEDQIFSNLQSLLEGGSVDAICTALQQNSFGDFGQLLESLQSALHPQAKPAVDVPKISPNEELPSAATLLQRIAEVHSIADEHSMASLREENICNYLCHPALPTAQLTNDSRKSLAVTLAKVIEHTFPTTTFSAKIERDNDTFGGYGKLISQILDAHPEFDLRMGNIELLFKNRGEKSQLASEDMQLKHTMQSIQLIFKLAPTFHQTGALFKRNVHSCSAIRAIGRTRFIAEFATEPEHPFTPEEGANVFHRAENTSIATSMLAGRIQSSSSALQLGAFSNSLPLARLEAILRDFPNLNTLFQFGEACACDDCMTVYSAAAYLVDTLLFLDQRWIIDTTGPTGSISTIGARKALFARRPELGDLDLNCANRNNALPYIDVVCELLEEEVAPDGGFTVPTTVPLDTGRVSPALLQLLVEDQGLSFTERATVSDKDKSTGGRIVRDSTVVVKLTPTPSGQSTGKVLKQTYQTADRLAAMPEYINTGAYDRLATSPYAFNLPFDLAHAETGAYFAQYSISRGKQLGESAETITKSIETVGKVLDKSAAMTAQQGSFQRRKEEWDFNAKLTGLDIDAINAQIDFANAKIDGPHKDLAAHDL
ncbi:putative Insecticidal toxin complex protein TccB2 [Serendipita sp. 399]|nr:putative Insecticidal toxin complex protein TccB2 [Serendipita sp. 399]